MDRKHLVSGLFWLAISIFVGFMALDLGLGTFSSPGSGFIFFWSSVGLGSLSVILIAKCIFRAGGAKPLADLWKDLKWGNPFLAIIILFVYALVLTKLGFILATFILMIVLFSLYDRRKWGLVIPASLAVIGITYLVFHVWLKVQFPLGYFRIG